MTNLSHHHKTASWRSYHIWQMASFTVIFAACLFFSLSSVQAAGSYETPKEETSAKIHNSYKQAQLLLAKKDYAQALAALEQVLKDEPDNADAWNLTGYSQRKLQNYDASFQAYERALSLDPQHSRAMEYMGELFLTLDRLPEAEAMLERMKKACVFNCKDRDMLKKAIADYKKTNS